jgi:hypothetical protein
MKEHTQQQNLWEQVKQHYKMNLQASMIPGWRGMWRSGTAICYVMLCIYGLNSIICCHEFQETPLLHHIQFCFIPILCTLKFLLRLFCFSEYALYKLILYWINTGGVSEKGRQINILFVIKTTGVIVLLLNSLSIWFVISVNRNYEGCFLVNCSSTKVPHYWQTWRLCSWCTVFQIWKEHTMLEIKVLNNCTRTVYFIFALHYSVQILWYLELVVRHAQRTYRLVKSTITAHQTILLPLGGECWIKHDIHYELKGF